MAWHDLLRSRRSVRYFENRPVPRQILERILETATYAPSAHHRQHWRFVVLTSLDAKKQLADAMGAAFRRDLEADGMPSQQVQKRLEISRSRMLSAPVNIVLCMDTSVGDRYPDVRRAEAERLMGVQSVALAGMQLLLAAQAECLGGVWTCGPLFAPETVRRALELPEFWQPQALIFLGYPAEVPQARPRRAVDEVTLWR